MSSNHRREGPLPYSLHISAEISGLPSLPPLISQRSSTNTSPIHPTSLSKELKYDSLDSTEQNQSTNHHHHHHSARLTSNSAPNSPTEFNQVNTRHATDLIKYTQSKTSKSDQSKQVVQQTSSSQRRSRSRSVAQPSGMAMLPPPSNKSRSSNSNSTSRSTSASTQQPHSSSNTTTNANSRTHTPTRAEEDRRRAMEKAREKEREEWERTRGAGSWVMRLKDKKTEIRKKNALREEPDLVENSASPSNREEKAETQSVKGKGKETSTPEEESEWVAEDVLPLLEEVEQARFEPSYVPSADQLLQRGISEYTILPKILGRGKFSSVFLAVKAGSGGYQKSSSVAANGSLTPSASSSQMNGYLSSNQTPTLQQFQVGPSYFAVKHTPLFPHHSLIATRLLREPTLLAELPPHPNLVAVVETIRTPGHFYLVEEYLGGYVTLEQLLPMLGEYRQTTSSSGSAPGETTTSSVPTLPPALADNIFTQLLSAVRAIHHPLQICHRDIKPENILVHPTTLQLKLLDFGLATHFSKSGAKLSTCCGSPAFHCPEIVHALASPPGTSTYWGPEVDAWTCGVTMLRVLTGVRYPLGSSHSSLRSMSIRTQRALSMIPDSPSKLRERVGMLLDMDAVKRMKALEDMAVQQEREMGGPERTRKEFRSTTFVKTEPSHRMHLPVLVGPKAEEAVASPNSSRTAHGGLSGRKRGDGGRSGRSTPPTSEASRSRSRRSTPSGSRASSPSPLSNPPSALTSPISEDDNAAPKQPSTPSLRVNSQNLQASQETVKADKPPNLQLQTIPRPIVLINPGAQPPQRLLSFIKYCLRCAGVLYHAWPDTTSALAAASGSNPSSSQQPFPGQGEHSLAPTSHPSVAGFSAALAAAHGSSAVPNFNSGAAFSPTTPLFPFPNGGCSLNQLPLPERADGYAHVHVFQCVVDLPERKDGTGTGADEEGGLSLVQTIMAAFGRKQSNRRSISQPPNARESSKSSTAAPASSTDAAHPDGKVRCLQFYLVVRFPKPGQSHHSNHRSRSQIPNGRRSRAGSAATTPLATTPTLNSGQFPSPAAHSNPFGGERELTSKRSVDLTMERSNSNSTINASNSGTFPRPRGRPQSLSFVGSPTTPTLELATTPISGTTSTGTPSHSPSRSRTASSAQDRKLKSSHSSHLHRKQMGSRNAKVFIQVSDERALDMVRQALMIGGSTETSDVEDDPSRDGDDSMVARNGNLSMPGTPRTAEKELQLQQQAFAGAAGQEQKKRASAQRSLSHAPLTTHGRYTASASSSTSDLHSAAAGVASGGGRASNAKTSSRARGGRAQSYSTPASQSQSRSHSRTTSRASTPTKEHSSGRASSDAGSSNRCEDVDESEEGEFDSRGRTATRKEQDSLQLEVQAPFSSSDPSQVDSSRPSQNKGLSSLAQTALQEESPSPSPDSKARKQLPEIKIPPSGLLGTPIQENPSSVGPGSGAILSTSVATIQPSDVGKALGDTETLAPRELSLETLVQSLETALEPLVSASARSGVHTRGAQSSVSINPSAHSEAHSQLEMLLNRLTSLERSDPDRLQEDLEPVIFSMVEALSPALGLVDQASDEPENILSTAIKSIPELSQEILQLIAKNASSPREVLLALQAGIETLIATGASSGEISPVDDGDGIEEDVVEDVANDEKKRLSKVKKDDDAGKAIWQVIGLLKVLATVFPRIKSKKPSNFTEPLASLLPRATVRLMGKLVVSTASWSAQSKPKSSDSTISEHLVRSVFDLCLSMAKWERSITGAQSQSQAEQPLSSDLIAIFLTSVGAIVPALQPRVPDEDGLTIAERQFRKSQPQFNIKGPSNDARSNPSQPTSPIWEELRIVVQKLGLNLERLAFERRSAPTSAVATNSPLAALETQRDAAVDETRSAAMSTGAFVMFVYLSAFDSSSTIKDWDSALAKVHLQLSLPLLLAAFGSSAQMPAAGFGAGKSVPGMRSVLTDSALLWLQWCFDAFSRDASKTFLPEGLVLVLIPALSVHAALSPSPTTRHMSFRLVASILDRHTEDAILLDILYDMVAETPFPQLRDASTNLIRELVGSRLPMVSSTSDSGPTSSLASRRLLEVLGEHLFALPDDKSLPSAVEPRQEGFDQAKHATMTYLEENSSILTSASGVYYFLLKRDQTNLTGIRDPAHLEAVEKRFLSPLRAGINAWCPIFAEDIKASSPLPSNSESDSQSALTLLQVLQLSMNSIDEAVKSLK